MMEVRAAVLDAPGAPFAVRGLTLAEPGPDEVVVEIRGVGLCHTDIAVQHGDIPYPLPAVLGHEGSGVVHSVGSAVTSVAPGDHVVLTFATCGTCAPCRSESPAYCARFRELNMSGVPRHPRPVLLDGTAEVGGSFFGQSSLATHALVHESGVVAVPGDLPVELLGPLGCGVQTGAGAVHNALDCEPGSSLLVTGGGSVGLSAVLAAVERGVGTIVVAEPVPARRELALALGATDVIDPANGLAELVRQVLPDGVNYAIDTTGVSAVLADAVAVLAPRGVLGALAVLADPSAPVPVGLRELTARGIAVRGIVEGDSAPQTYIPRLVQLYRAGRFPLDRLVTTMPFSSINDAIEAQARGGAVKVVLVHD